MKADRLVVDTNVLISAVLSATGTAARLFDQLRIRRTSLIFSPPTVEELHGRLMQPKFNPYVSRASRVLFLAQIEAVSEMVSISGTRLGCRDRAGDMFLETAVLGEADCLISGDKDLLVMHPFQGVPILSPAQLLDRLD